MRLLALDIGARRTGVAFFEDAVGFPIALHTIVHEGDAQLLRAVDVLASERKADALVIGLPLLPSGEEGKQARLVRSIGKRLASCGRTVLYLDERHTTERGTGCDPDARSACVLLTTFIERAAKRR